jgi:hypothetical protein
MTDTTLLISRIAEIVEGGRNSTNRVRLRGSKADVGMAFQAHEALLRACQHARVRRAVRLMAGPASFHLHRRMLKRERPAFVRVAPHATRLVRVDGVHHARKEASMRIVAIYAGHRALGQEVTMRPLKFGPRLSVATGALRVYRFVPARHNVVPFGLVNGMAGYACDRIPAVTALHASGMSE